MDWMRLCSSGKDLSGTGGRILKLTMEDVKKHKTEDDAWMVLRGKVFLNEIPLIFKSILETGV